MAGLPVLTYSERAVPFAVLAAVKLLDSAVETRADASLGKDAAPVLTFPTGETLTGTATLLRYLARAAGAECRGLYGATPLEAGQIDAWIDASAGLAPGAGLLATAQAVSAYLTPRTFLVGYALTLADVAVWGQLQGNLQWDKLRKGADGPGGPLADAGRWYDFVSGVPELADIAESLGPRRRFSTPKPSANAELAAGALGGGDVGSFDIGLEGAEMGKVVTRFPPEPSGYLHIGHAKAALLNQHIADLYRGEMRVRFDDTNPSKEKDEYTQAIIADMARLGLRYREPITYTSDYFPQLLACARLLVSRGDLYADDTPVERMRAERMDGIESVHRNRPARESAAIFEEMLIASDVGQRNCLRVKLDMTNPNKALRDPVAYRCNLEPHWRTGSSHRCYPTYDFACPMVDALEGVTHALRTSEYRDREAQFYAILKLQAAVWPEPLPTPKLWDYARLAFIHTVLSKRKLTAFVADGVVTGWDDPRMPTVQGILRRGLRVEALREFILQQGASKNMTYQEWDKIWTMNKKLIDPVCPRHTAVLAEGKVTVRLSGGPAPGTTEEVTVPRHAKYPPAGTKTQSRTDTLLLDAADAEAVADGEEVTLMGWGNAILTGRSRNAATGATEILDATLDLAGDFKKTRLKLTWLADIPALVPLELHTFGYLITKKRLEEDDVFEEFVNRDSRIVEAALGDAATRTLVAGDVLQLERKGYFRVDVPAGADGSPAILFNIPDGRTKNMPGASA